jgi:hypothetical protein
VSAFSALMVMSVSMANGSNVPDDVVFQIENDTKHACRKKSRKPPQAPTHSPALTKPSPSSSHPKLGKMGGVSE